jgi:hypothetical protein
LKVTADMADPVSAPGMAATFKIVHDYADRTSGWRPLSGAVSYGAVSYGVVWYGVVSYEVVKNGGGR